jgi:uncharacterized membrane protein
MRYSNDLSVLILAACFLGAMSCSDDDSSDSNPLQPQAGAAGSAGAAGAGGSAGAAGAAGAGGSAGSGGSGADSLADVRFSDVHPVLVDNCGECHGATDSFLPPFAQDDEDAAYQVTQEVSSYPGELYNERIVERAVDELTMPPGCFGDLGSTGCLSVEDAELLQAWVDQGALR